MNGFQRCIKHFGTIALKKQEYDMNLFKRCIQHFGTIALKKQRI